MLLYLRDKRRRIFRRIGLWFMRRAGPLPKEELDEVAEVGLKVAERFLEKTLPRDHTVVR